MDVDGDGKQHIYFIAQSSEHAMKRAAELQFHSYVREDKWSQVQDGITHAAIRSLYIAKCL